MTEKGWKLIPVKYRRRVNRVLWNQTEAIEGTVTQVNEDGVILKNEEAFHLIPRLKLMEQALEYFGEGDYIRIVNTDYGQMLKGGTPRRLEFYVREEKE